MSQDFFICFLRFLQYSVPFASSHCRWYFLFFDLCLTDLFLLADFLFAFFHILYGTGCPSFFHAVFSPFFLLHMHIFVLLFFFSLLFLVLSVFCFVSSFLKSSWVRVQLFLSTLKACTAYKNNRKKAFQKKKRLLLAVILLCILCIHL